MRPIASIPMPRHDLSHVRPPERLTLAVEMRRQALADVFALTEPEGE